MLALDNRKRRWFVLSQSVLAYYTKDGPGRVIKGKIAVNDFEEVRSPNSSECSRLGGMGMSDGIIVKTPSRIYKFQVECVADRGEWLLALSAAKRCADLSRSESMDPGTAIVKRRSSVSLLGILGRRSSSGRSKPESPTAAFSSTSTATTVVDSHSTRTDPVGYESKNSLEGFRLSPVSSEKVGDNESPGEAGFEPVYGNAEAEDIVQAQSTGIHEHVYGNVGRGSEDTTVAEIPVYGNISSKGSLTVSSEDVGAPAYSNISTSMPDRPRCRSTAVGDDQLTKDRFSVVTGPPNNAHVSVQQVEHAIDQKPEYFGIALFDFIADDAEELGLRKGDIVKIMAYDHAEWWHGEICNGTGKSGLFPANYVAQYHESPDIIVNDDAVSADNSVKIKSLDSKLTSKEVQPSVSDKVIAAPSNIALELEMSASLHASDSLLKKPSMVIASESRGTGKAQSEESITPKSEDSVNAKVERQLEANTESPHSKYAQTAISAVTSSSVSNADERLPLVESSSITLSDPSEERSYYDLEESTYEPVLIPRAEVICHDHYEAPASLLIPVKAEITDTITAATTGKPHKPRKSQPPPVAKKSFSVPKSSGENRVTHSTSANNSHMIFTIADREIQMPVLPPLDSRRVTIDPDAPPPPSKQHSAALLTTTSSTPGVKTGKNATYANLDSAAFRITEDEDPAYSNAETVANEASGKRALLYDLASPSNA